MESTARHNLQARQYRLASFLVVIGSLTLGTLLLSRFTELFYDSVFFYYGVGEGGYQELRKVSGLPLTVAQLSVAAMALVGAIFFIATERHRVGRIAKHRRACGQNSTLVGIQRLGAAERILVLGNRTAMFAGTLLGTWLMQMSYERYSAGLGWSVAPGDWTSLTPIATIFLVCVLLGLGAAAVSMVGLRALVSLQAALAEIRYSRRIRRYISRFTDLVTGRALRDRYGLDILSRPPPVTV